MWPLSSTCTNAAATCDGISYAQRNIRITDNCCKQSQKGVRIEPWQNVWRKWHVVSFMYASTICCVDFFVVFVVVQWRFFVAFLREHRLVLLSLFLPPMFPARLCLARDTPRRANNQNILYGCRRPCDTPTPSKKLSPKIFCKGMFSHFYRSAERSARKSGFSILPRVLFFLVLVILVRQRAEESDANAE